MISANEAQRIISENVSPTHSLTVSLESALGYVLAEDVTASENIPRFDNASMDGYAVRAGDIVPVPATVQLAGEIAAGNSATNVLRPHEAMSIMTGAPIPAGCTAVVQQEWTVKPDVGHVTILRGVSEGHNIRKTGADIASGSVALPKGISIRPQEIGILASLGKRFISVYKKPSVAVLATGDELIEIDKASAPGKIRNSNAYLLCALIRETGCEVSMSQIARDIIEDLQEKITESLHADVLVTTGGVSVGKYDLVCQAFENLGITILFRKVNIKPGMPFVFGVRRPSIVFGLPGNPVSTMVTFLKFVRPALEKIGGLSTGGKKYVLHARLAEPIAKSDGKRHYVRGILENDRSGLIVRSTGPQVSNILSSMTKANCLIILQEDKDRFETGEPVEVELLP
jgi:molybdopterin molybdotransferase